MRHYLDKELLARLTRSKRGRKTLREIAVEIGIEIGSVSPSTLSRVENGKMPDMETFLFLCEWLQVPPSTFLINAHEEGQVTNLEPIEALLIQLHTDKNLDSTTANVLAALIRAAYRELSQPK
jgi:transcriptional regulator with XRE-family HTH domain